MIIRSVIRWYDIVGELPQGDRSIKCITTDVLGLYLFYCTHTRNLDVKHKRRPCQFVHFVLQHVEWCLKGMRLMSPMPIRSSIWPGRTGMTSSWHWQLSSVCVLWDFNICLMIFSCSPCTNLRASMWPRGLGNGTFLADRNVLEKL